MNANTPNINSELDTHRSNLNGWINDVTNMKVCDSKKGVHDRYVRDCKTLLSDIDGASDPSSEDLCDFKDRADSLEIVYTDLTEPFDG